MQVQHQYSARVIRGEPLLAPVLEYSHSGTPGGQAIVGGYLYRGEELSGFQGTYFFGDWARPSSPRGSLFMSTPQASGLWPVNLVPLAGAPAGQLPAYLLGMGQDQAGELYVLTSEYSGPTGNTGQVYKLAPGR